MSLILIHVLEATIAMLLIHSLIDVNHIKISPVELIPIVDIK